VLSCNGSRDVPWRGEALCRRGVEDRGRGVAAGGPGPSDGVKNAGLSGGLRVGVGGAAPTTAAEFKLESGSSAEPRFVTLLLRGRRNAPVGAPALLLVPVEVTQAVAGGTEEAGGAGP
jgi:hypothetical protein